MICPMIVAYPTDVPGPRYRTCTAWSAPSQVLMGQSSFNYGDSISAGLPKYARNEIRTGAGLL